MLLFKKPSQITSSDLPWVLSPFYAVSKVDQLDLQTNFYHGGSGRHGNMMQVAPGVYMNREELREQVQKGDFLVLDMGAGPQHPMANKQPSNGNGSSQWVLDSSAPVGARANAELAIHAACSQARMQKSVLEPPPPQTAEPAPDQTPGKTAKPKETICELIYLPDQDMVLALNDDELEKVRREERIMDDLARRILGADNADQLRKAKLNLSEHINSQVISGPLVKGDTADFVEIHRIGGKKFSYVPRELISSLKQNGLKAFTLTNRAKGQDTPETLRTKDSRLDSKAIKEKLSNIGFNLKHDFEIVPEKSGQFSVRPMIYALTPLPLPDAAVDKLDQWIAALNKRLRWSTNEKERARDRIVDLLEKQESDSPWLSWFTDFFKAKDNTRYYRIFDEDDLGLVKNTVRDIWGDDPEHTDWVSQVDSVTFMEMDRKALAHEIRNRPLPEAKYNAEAQAQLMRYAYGFTAGTDFDLLKGKLAANVKFELDLALFEGKATGNVLLPEPKGRSIHVPMTRKDYKNQYRPTDHEWPNLPTFRFNETFLTPSAMGIIKSEFDAWHKANKNRFDKEQNGPSYKLQLTGHADQPGTEAYNLTLSEHRARVVYGFLTQDPGQWCYLFSLSENHGGWGNPEIKAMLNCLGFNTNGNLKESIAAFQQQTNQTGPRDGKFLVPDGHMRTTGDPPDPTLVALIEGYMKHGGLPQPMALDHFMTPPYTGAGESAPEIDTPNPEELNRRVSWTLQEFRQVDIVTEKKEVPLGHMRFAVALSIGGYMGANLMAGADIHFDINPKGVSPEQQGRLLAKGVHTLGPGAGAEASAFAGAKAEAGLTGTLQWKSPEPVPKDIKKKDEFVDLGSVGYTLIGQVGLNLTGKIQVGFDETIQKFVIKAEASAALGPGFGGKLAFAVGIKHTYNFIAMVYTQLRDNDFSFVDFFDDQERTGLDVFSLFCSWSYQMLLKGRLIEAGALGVGAIGAKVMGEGTELVRDWRRSWEEVKHVEQLIDNINEDAEVLRYTTPEVKGRILYLLIRPEDIGFKVDTLIDSRSKDRKQAVNTVLSWIQSKRHCQEVLEHMGVNIPQGDSIEEKGRRLEQNKEYIIDYLEGLGVDAKKWQKWYDNLPDEPDKGAVKQRNAPATP